ncbi:hypothetical protein U1Q18_010342, partial [Sarracenia purpurea var. burkii]
VELDTVLQQRDSLLGDNIVLARERDYFMNLLATYESQMSDALHGLIEAYSQATTISRFEVRILDLEGQVASLSD